MTNTTIQLKQGLAVIGKHGNGEISKVITHSTGYVEVLYYGIGFKKEMAFNLTTADGTPLRQKPTTQARPVAAEKTEFEKIKSVFMFVNQLEHHPNFRKYMEIPFEFYATVKMCCKDNQLVSDIAASVARYSKCSEKQAYHLAMWATKNADAFGKFYQMALDFKMAF